jgi:O-antigen/teichoic acid export membrane protein
VTARSWLTAKLGRGRIRAGQLRAGRSPLLRNGYALMANTAVTGLLGLLYWLLAARRYEAADVGRASAAYSAMNLLAGITALSLIGAMARFLPRAGSRTGKLIRLGYGLSVLSAVVGSMIFLLISARPGSSYSELAGPVAGLVFTGCVIVWSLFTLQDGALIGLRNANWVTRENAVFGVAKIAMLIPLATLIPHAGLYVSWMVPAALAVPVVNWLIFRRIVPRHVRESGPVPPPGRRDVGRFLAGDVSGALLLLATISLVPVLVALVVAPDTNAYFYMAWTIGITIDLLAANMALSLTVEGAFDPVSLAAHAKAALRRILMIIVPLAIGIAALAPYILGLFGPGYAKYGAPILVLLLAATLPRTLTEIYLGALRAQNRTSRVALVQGIRAVAILGLTLVLTRSMGIIGAGIAVLISQVVIAVAVLPGLLKVLRAGHRAPAAGPQELERVPIPEAELEGTGLEGTGLEGAGLEGAELEGAA